MRVFSREFALTTLGAAVRTFAQVMGALLIEAGTGLVDTDWVRALSVAGMASLLAVLMCVADGRGAPGFGGRFRSAGQAPPPVAGGERG